MKSSASLELSLHRGCSKLSDQESSGRCTALLDVRSCRARCFLKRGSGLDQNQGLRISSNINQFILLRTQHPAPTPCYFEYKPVFPQRPPKTSMIWTMIPSLPLLLFLLLLTSLCVHVQCCSPCLEEHGLSLKARASPDSTNSWMLSHNCTPSS